jgi:HK97 family phage major capsid protein
MKKSDMIAKRDELLNEARQITETAATEKRGMTDDEREAVDAKVAEARGLRDQTDSLDALRAELGVIAPTADQPVETPEIGLSGEERKSYSFQRAIRAAASGDWRDAGFERACSEAAEAKHPGNTRHGNLLVPHDVMVGETRDMTKGTATGDKLVATDHLSGSFIDLLRNRMVLRAAGARFMSGLVGDVAIPKRTTGTTGYWVSENGAPTESQSVFAQVTLNPKTVAGYEDISRQLLLQSTPDAEMLIRDDLAQTLAIAIDYAGLHGSGSSNQPTGIASVSGIGSVVGGTNGANPDWADIIDLETAVAVDNADIGALSYVVNAATRGFFKQTVRVSSTDSRFIWGDGATPLNGYSAHVSNQVSSTLTKGTSTGVCSAIFFGNWNDLLIGMWGGLDLLVDPFSNSTTGQIRVVAFQSVDIAVRHAESFAAMLDATLT